MSKCVEEFNPLNATNILEAICIYEKKVKELQITEESQGKQFLTYLKRDKTEVGPYPDTTFFESANRAMTDLVILYGVKWLLDNKSNINQYLVEYGHANKNDFDLMAPDEKEPVLIAEAFNVAQSFFQGKKSRMLSKLRNKKWINVSEKYLLVNSDAVTEDYSPKLNEGVKILFVDINTGECKEVF